MTVTANKSFRPPGSGSMPVAHRFSLSDVTSKGKNLPSRIVLHGVEGIGKTSFGAQFAKPVFLMARGETGLETLIDSGRLSDVPHFPEIKSFSDVFGVIDFLTTETHDYRTIVVDTLNGCERLCHEHVCQRDFRGDWTDKGFMGYMRGFEVSLADWRELLNKLDALRETKSMAVVCLCHTKVKTFKNPEGADFDRYAPDVHDKTWSLTHKWADMVLFANYEMFVDESGSRAKGKGGTERMLYTERTAAWDAKNRHGLPPEISMGRSSKEGFTNLHTAIKQGRLTEKAGE